MKKPLDVILKETWALFRANLVLIVPMVAFVLAYALFLGASFSIIVFTGILKVDAIVREFKNLIGNGYDPAGIWNFMRGSLAGLFAALMLLSVLMFVVSAIHSAGIGWMFARAATCGKTGMRDYLEGIGRFFGRMMSLIMMKTGLLLLPVLAVLIVALIAMLALPSEAAIIVVIIILAGGSMFSMAVCGVASFLLWMWKPAVFVRDLGVNEALTESYRFALKKFGVLFIIAALMTVFNMVIGLPSNVMSIFMQAGQNGGVSIPPHFILLAVAVFIPVTLITFAIGMTGRTYFVLLYYKVYADEWRDAAAGRTAAPAPAVIADPQALASLGTEHLYTPDSEPPTEPPADKR